MANAYNNKVVLSNGTTIIDLSTDTVTDASHIMSGKVGHLADGSVVTGTGASESQVVSIEDVPNTTGTTAVITGVAAPEGSISITTNGTHDVYNYETAVVAVPSIDVPTFSSSDGVTITCDKTYAQCLAILNGGENRAFISFAGSNPDSLAGVNDLGILRYYYVYAGALNARIDYRSNGSITISSVDTGQTLDVTSNGTYTQSDDNAWARVNVNVPTGSATIQPLTVTSNGTYTAPSGVDGYSPVTVNVSGGGGSADVIFIDYDGTVLHSYSASEFANLTEMPSNPSHTGLVAQGWNWTLSDAKAQVEAIGSCIVGQMYETDDGSTRIYVDIQEGGLSPYLCLMLSGTAEIDWGDGTTSSLVGSSSTAISTIQHTYATPGSYRIKVAPGLASTVYNIPAGDTGSSGGPGILTESGSASSSANSFKYSLAITKIELGSGVAIGTYAFNNCRNLKSITVPEGTAFKLGSFARCSALDGLVLSPSNTTVPGLFANCYNLKAVSIPYSVTAINGTAFQNCNSLSFVSIPAQVTSIAANAFDGCSTIDHIVMPGGMTTVSNYTFANCYSLKSVVLPSAAKTIGKYAFQNCYSLKEVDIPQGITSLGTYAFSGCYSLRSVSLPSGVTTIGTYAFNDTRSMRSITIPNTGKALPGNVLGGSGVVDVTLPEGITSIGPSSFYACNSLRNVSLPSTISGIGSSAFFGCYSINKITIPAAVTNIGASAFYNCFGIREYHFEPATPPTLSSTNAFNGIVSGTTIYVPQGSLEAYQTATNWSTYASYMVEEE